MISTPTLWGKYPSHADYVGIRVKGEESHAWHAWCTQNLYPADQSKLTHPHLNHQQFLDSEHQKNLQQIPVSFVLPPKTMSFCPKYYLIGVMVWSKDRIGRNHPLIVYQQASKSWIQQQWIKKDSLHIRKDWLFWLSRLVHECTKHMYISDNTHEEHRPEKLLSFIDLLWKHFEPGWKQSLGFPLPSPTEHVCQEILHRFRASHEKTFSLRGVPFLPWVDWPQSLMRENIDAFFWQQDDQGLYLGASHSLTDIWSIDIRQNDHV
jgi:type VI secretion system protein ImpM